MNNLVSPSTFMTPNPVCSHGRYHLPAQDTVPWLRDGEGRTYQQLSAQVRSAALQRFEEGENYAEGCD